MLPDVAAVYQQLYGAHAGAVLAYLNNELRDPGVAEDVSQDAWLKVHRFLPRVLAAGGDGGKPWLMHIATNAMLDHFRRVKARPQTSALDDALAPGVLVADALLDWETPESASLDQTEQAGQQGMVGALLLAVPRRAREVLWWREYGLRSYAELARRYDCTVPSVKSTLYRTRQLLDALVASERAAQQTRTGGIVGRFAHLADRRSGADACWPWFGTLNRGRAPWSPMLKVGGKAGRMVPARRVAYALRHGALPPWVYPISTCTASEPRLCVNPAHLVGARKSGHGMGASGGCYVPLEASLLAPNAFADQRLVARRLALGITAKEVAALVGVYAPNIHQAESTRARWRRGPVLLQRISAVLDRLEREQQEAMA